MKVLVKRMSGKINVITGGKGHVGFALVKELADRGEKIRLLLRSDSPVFDKIDCEKFMGDVCDLQSLERTFEGADTVYHVAGVVDISGKKDKQVWEVNVEGTKKVVEACKKTGVKTLVYVSSIDAIPMGEGNDELAEISHFDPDLLEGTYAKSKAVATQYVLDNADDSLKVCVVHPSTCIGPYDNNGTSSMASVIKLFSKGMFPMTFDFGSCNFIDVRDCAKVMVAAAEKGGNKECYLACGSVISLDDFIGVLADVCGKKHPKMVLRKDFIDKVIPVYEKISEVAKLPPMINEYSIRKINENFNFVNTKARNELGFEPRPLRQSLVDTVEWEKNHKN